MAIQYEIRNAATDAVLLEAWEIDQKAQRVNVEPKEMALRIIRQVSVYSKEIKPILKRVD